MELKDREEESLDEIVVRHLLELEGPHVIISLPKLLRQVVKDHGDNGWSGFSPQDIVSRVSSLQAPREIALREESQGID